MTDQLYNIVNDIECQSPDDSFIFSDENFKFIKDQLEEKEDVIFYKEECLKETNDTENENVEDLVVKNEDKNIIEMIEYIEKKNDIPEEKKTKRGRKKNIEKNTFECHKGKKPIEHNKFKPDNIRIKIKTHYHNFIISFFNDLIKARFKIQRYKFRKVCYSITKEVTIKKNQNLMKMTLGEFLSQNISQKYKCEINQNEKTFNIIKNILKNESDKKLFDLNYCDFYMNYYLIHDKEEIVNNYGIQDRTEFFNDLIDKIGNTNYQKSIMNIAHYHFIQYFFKDYENKSCLENKEIFLGKKTLSFGNMSFNENNSISDVNINENSSVYSLDFQNLGFLK
jgi:hypothetical protein